jgi:hypothetical protein
LQVKSIKGNKLTAKTRTKPRNSKSPGNNLHRPITANSELDMFDSKIQSQSKKSVDLSLLSDSRGNHNNFKSSSA